MKIPGCHPQRSVRIQSIFFIMVICIGNLYADAQAEQFYRANKLFEEKQYKEARQEYEGLKTKGPLTWYNIGVCYGHEENAIESFVAFHKALKGADAKLLNEIYEGIDNARDYLTHEKYLVIRKLHYYGSYFSLFWLQILFLFFWFSLFFCWFYKKKTPRSLRLILGCLVIWSAVSLGAVWWVRSRNYVITLKEDKLYAGPNQEYHSVGDVKIAEQLTLLDFKNSWYKVKSSSAVGWVKEETVKQV